MLEGYWAAGISRLTKGQEPEKSGYLWAPPCSRWKEKVQGSEARRCLSGLPTPPNKTIQAKAGSYQKTRVFDKTAGKQYANVKLTRRGGG